MPTPRLLLFASLAFVLIGAGFVLLKLQGFQLTTVPSLGEELAQTKVPQATAAVGGSYTLVGAGDIASCEGDGDEKTAALVAGIPGTVFTLGDNVYPEGTSEAFSSCYTPSWGRFKDRTRPIVGNHEYRDRKAAGYFAYFGGAAGAADRGYYSYTLGNWKVVALNSNCREVGGCDVESEQYRWLEQEIVGQTCVVAMMHHPRFSSGKNHGSTEALGDIWRLLYREGVEVALAGHEHLYERFSPLNAEGDVDQLRGVRAFTVGTGGKDLYGFSTPLPGSEVRNNRAMGVLQLTLSSNVYRWQFLPVLGESFTDSGRGSCH